MREVLLLLASCDCTDLEREEEVRAHGEGVHKGSRHHLLGLHTLNPTQLSGRCIKHCRPSTAARRPYQCVTTVLSRITLIGTLQCHPFLHTFMLG